MESFSKLSKFIARSGLCSRRRALEFILAGKVKVGANVVYNNIEVDDSMDIFVNDRPVSLPVPRLWMYHKRLGSLVTHADELGRRTVFNEIRDQYPNLPPVLSVGRLDANSEVRS
jgi:23S rRNA pseudouridine2605 synthase